MFRLLGILSASDIVGLSSQVAAKLYRDKSYLWLSNKTIGEELDRHLKTQKVRANARSKKGIFRLLCQKLSRHLLGRCARAHSAEVKSGRLTDAKRFLIHEHMSPWVLIDEHAVHLRHPEKDWVFWSSKPHCECRRFSAGSDRVIRARILKLV